MAIVDAGRVEHPAGLHVIPPVHLIEDLENVGRWRRAGRRLIAATAPVGEAVVAERCDVLADGGETLAYVGECQTRPIRQIPLGHGGVPADVAAGQLGQSDIPSGCCWARTNDFLIRGPVNSVTQTMSSGTT